ncbi:MAG: four helix bundle protein [Prevotella sp.]|nr:four helix bundle protein [Prevotella sp.]
MKKNVVEDKSFEFAVRIVKLYKYLTAEKQEYIMSKQLLRSGTSVGANVSEAQQAQSPMDFLSKMNIALKESYESDYWLRLLYRTEYLKKEEYNSIITDCRAISKLLVSIVKSTKNNNNQ